MTFKVPTQVIKLYVNFSIFPFISNEQSNIGESFIQLFIKSILHVKYT